MTQEYTSKNTSVNKNKLPAIFKKIKWNYLDLNLDYGGGKYDNATKYLRTLGVVNKIYDPYNRSEEENKYTERYFGLYSSCTLSNVLNVIKEKEVRRSILIDIEFALNRDGVLYITVYEGNKSGIGKMSKKDCWQNNLRLASYIDEVKEIFPVVEIKNNMIIARKGN